ncbi:MAG TPA: hypothetical protein P5531_03990 [Bacteroidales bacterium]|nr:hypothetical protein [Bacteroidales bacterium]
MISTLDIQDLLYLELQNDGIGTTLTGGIYKDRRPDNSVLEDIVIGCLPVTGDTIQYCTGNVNIYVPDIKVTLAGKSQMQPNHKRLKVLCARALSALEYVTASTYEITVQNQSLFDEEKQHFINIRLNIRVFN